MINNTMIVGLTGPSGSGKSEIAKLLSSNKEILIIDADKISHNLLNNNPVLKSTIIKHFSDIILTPNNTIDRCLLGRIVFNDKNKLLKLNQMIFPYIKLDIINIIKLNKQYYKIILLDAPTLIESKLNLICNKVIVITAPIDVRLNRIIKRDNISLKEAQNRLNSQLPEDQYLNAADFIIQNDKNLYSLKNDLDIILNKIK